MKRKNKLLFCIVSLLLIVHVLMVMFYYYPSDFGYSATGEIWRHFVYQFVHTGVIHITLNVISLILLIRSCYIKVSDLFVAYLISIACSFFVYNLTTVGASGVIYALVGIFIVGVATDKQMQKKYRYMNCTLMILPAFIIPFINSQINWQLHLVCMIVGITYQCFVLDLRKAKENIK